MPWDFCAIQPGSKPTIKMSPCALERDIAPLLPAGRLHKVTEVLSMLPTKGVECTYKKERAESPCWKKENI